jgi:uncharacterized membrane protein
MIKSRDLTFGILMFLGFVAYYLFMRLTGLYTNTYLRVFNFAIQFGVIFIMMKSSIKPKFHVTKSPQVMLSGIKASIIGVSAFVAFMVLYLGFFEPSFLETLQQASPLGKHLNLATATILLFTEGMLAGAVSTFIAQRYLRSQLVKNTEKGEISIANA